MIQMNTYRERPTAFEATSSVMSGELGARGRELQKYLYCLH